MVKIRSIETIGVAVPTRWTHKRPGLTEPIGGYVLVRMEGDDGKVGCGEAPCELRLPKSRGGHPDDPGDGALRP